MENTLAHKDKLYLLRWMQKQDRNGDYLEEPLPSMEYAIETLKEWEEEHEADIPHEIKEIMSKYQ